MLFIVTLCLLFTSCTIPGNNSIRNTDFPNRFDMTQIDSSVASANTGFSLEIFKKLNQEEPDGNIFISPFSISTALAMVYNGAREETKQQMDQVLGFGNTSLSTVNTTYQNLIAYLNQVDKKVSLNISNSVWIREGEEINEEFLQNTGKYFNAYTKMMDFSKAESANVINEWISKATNNKISKMINPPISDDVIMYLINAIYFKGEWTDQFDAKATKDEEFYMEDGSSQDVKLMHRKGKVEYAEGEDYKAVRLPYGSGKTSMYCILPDENMKINDFIAGLSAEKWESFFQAPSRKNDVVLEIPKFKMEYGIKLLNNSLISLGMPDAFNDNADFSGIRDDICISRVLHKAVIEVNEEGSEAAAATVVEMTTTSAMIDEKPLSFIANRPFLFLIVDDETGTILFIGKMCQVP